mgnify:FL=1
MKRKVGILVIISIIYAIVTGWYYVRIIKKKEFFQSEEKVLPPFSSSFGEHTVKLQTSLEVFKTSVLDKKRTNTVLEFKGYYSSNEVNTTSYDNLGLARAHYLRSIVDTLEDSEVRIVSRMMELAQDTQNFESVVVTAHTRNEFVEENGSGALLFTSLVGEDRVKITPEIDAYLTYLSIEERDKAFDIIGHCYSGDSTGENTVKALQMATIVKQSLIDKGMNDYQISAVSKGDEAPLYGTDSVDRLELIINSNF